LQANPAGIFAQLISLLKKLRPPVRLTQVSFISGISAQPFSGLIEPEQTVMFGKVGCIAIVSVASQQKDDGCVPG
jgi:hypothetical protein